MTIQILYQIKATVITPLGEFSGTCTEGHPDVEFVRGICKNLIDSMQNITSLNLSSNAGNTLINEKILKDSVIIFKIISTMIKN